MIILSNLCRGDSKGIFQQSMPVIRGKSEVLTPSSTQMFMACEEKAMQPLYLKWDQFTAVVVPSL